MPTEASTQILLSDSSEDLIVSEPWSIDNYADGLMDELFADIDHILDGKGSIPVPTIEPEFVRLQSVKVPPIVVPASEVRSAQATATAQTVNQQNPHQQLTKVVTKKTPTVKTVIKQRRQPRRWLSKLLGLGATVGVAIAAVVSVQNSGLLNRLVSRSFQQTLLPSPTQTESELSLKVDVETELVNYMLGALSAIDRQEVKTNSQSTNNAYKFAYTKPQEQTLAMAGTPSGQLPPPMAANNIPPSPTRSTQVVERIYIPVYQAPLPMRYAPPAIPGVRGILPAVPSQPQNTARLPKPPSVKTAINNVSKNVTKNVSKATNPLNVFAAVRPGLKPITLQNKPITLQQPKPPSIKIAAFRAVPPKLPTATAPTAPKQQTERPQTPPQEVAVAPTTPATTHTLEGLLELGQKSAALFKVNGVSRRIEIGEGIGTSGWTLVEVANGEAIIRRNGEVRSVFAGQNF